MYLYLNEELNKLEIISKDRLEVLYLKEVYVDDNFNYTKEILYKNKKIIVDMSAQEILEKINYRDLRRCEYPKIEEQLDMLYKDFKNNTNKWESLITDIKEKYPKGI